MAKVSEDPPLVDVKITNPITYIKRWWKKVVGNEGMTLTIKVKPLTTIFIFAVTGSLIFGVGKFAWPGGLKIPFLEFGDITEPTSTPKQSAETWKETAYIGTLKYSTSTQKYFLITTSAVEAITLDIPPNLNLSTLIEKRILVVGKYSRSLRVIQVFDAKDLEVLPTTPIPIPTNTPSPEPTQTPTQAPTSTPEANPSASPTG